MKYRILGLALLVVSIVGCGDEPQVIVKSDTKFSGPLAVDIKGNANIELIAHSDDTIDVTIDIQGKEAIGLIDPAAKFTAKGTIEHFPETDMSLYVAKFWAPASNGGPCAADPISLALSIERRGKNARVGGSVTAYCGKDKFYGVPARVLRLTGELPFP